MAVAVSFLVHCTQVDGYTAYTSLAKARAKAGSNEAIQLAGCWAHLRRKFYDLHISGVLQATTASIIAMAELWKLEDKVRGMDANTRAELRQERSICQSLLNLVRQPVTALLGRVDGGNIVLQDNMMHVLFEPQTGKPASMHLGPRGAVIMVPMPEQEADNSCRAWRRLRTAANRARTRSRIAS